jgi:hypothetical protein
MAIFKVMVIKETTWTETSTGTAYIRASSLEQAEKKARRINRAIENAEYDLSEFDDVDFDEGNTVLINLNDVDDIVQNNLPIDFNSISQDPDDTSFKVSGLEEIKDSIDKSNIWTLSVPDRS